MAVKRSYYGENKNPYEVFAGNAFFESSHVGVQGGDTNTMVLGKWVVRVRGG
jgi:hypothetical protein